MRSDCSSRAYLGLPTAMLRGEVIRMSFDGTHWG